MKFLSCSSTTSLPRNLKKCLRLAKQKARRSRVLTQLQASNFYVSLRPCNYNNCLQGYHSGLVKHVNLFSPPANILIESAFVLAVELCKIGQNCHESQIHAEGLPVNDLVSEQKLIAHGGDDSLYFMFYLFIAF